MSNQIEDVSGLNSKNLLSRLDEMYTFKEEDYGLDGDGLTPGADAAPEEEEAENALLDVIDIGLDLAADFLKEAGYPELKRGIWEQRGRVAMNKALNAYLPATNDGVGLDSPLFALFIGVGCLGICFAPAIMHYVKTRPVKIDEAAEQAIPEPEKMPAAPENPPLNLDNNTWGDALGEMSQAASLDLLGN